MKKYLCINDYHPLIGNKDRQYYMGEDPVVREEVNKHNSTIQVLPTKKAVVIKGDILTQMGKGDSRFRSKQNPDCALYEYTLQQYSDCFKEIQ